MSKNPYVVTGDTTSLVNEGTLLVVRFDVDGTGDWLALTPETTDMDAAMIAIHTRMAGSAVGATTMDRPEWVAFSSDRRSVFVGLQHPGGSFPDGTGLPRSTVIVVERDDNVVIS